MRFYLLIFTNVYFYVLIRESRYNKFLKTRNYFQNISINIDLLKKPNVVFLFDVLLFIFAPRPLRI